MASEQFTTELADDDGEGLGSEVSNEVGRVSEEGSVVLTQAVRLLA